MHFFQSGIHQRDDNFLPIAVIIGSFSYDFILSKVKSTNLPRKKRKKKSVNLSRFRYNSIIFLLQPNGNINIEDDSVEIYGYKS